jgi:hypothetical protein
MIVNKGTEMEKYWTEIYLHQNQPIQMPYGTGIVLIDPVDPCVQQYVGPK